MAQRGRVSGAALSVVANVQHMPRPAAPDHLNDEEAQEWKRITSSLPADWIKSHAQPILAELCVHIVRAKRITEIAHSMEEDPEFDFRDYDRVSRAHERESRAIASLSVKLRISPSTEYRKEQKREDQIDRSWTIRNPRRNEHKVD